MQFTPSSTEVRALPPQPNAEQAFFQLDIRRSLALHWQLARAVALGFVALAVVYFLAQVFVLKSWPTYMAESIVYVQPTPAKVLPNQGGSPRWPFDSNTYETYIQQQMMNVSRQDVLVAALHKLKGFQRSGESDQAAALRLVRLLEVTRIGAAYQFSISARAANPAMAAQIANAVTAAYIESASRDERTGDAQRLQMLSEERDRIQTALTADRTEQDALNKQLGVASVSSAVPDHYDEDITQIRTELVKARTDHDEAESKFASLGAGHGASSSAIDAAADEMIANDAGLVSMKQALNTRRATLISQMANLTPLNPQYKQDEAELAKINGTLDVMMKDLRAKAAARIQLQLRADLERTGGVEARLNGQLRQLVGAATSATPKMQRSGDLAADITRLQARYASVDEQLHNLMLEDNAPAAAYQVTQAAPPLGRTKSGVLRNVLMIAFAGLFFGVLAAIGARKLDPKVYISSDVEQVLGFAPLAQLPDFREVSKGAAEEYMLRLASAIEHARKQGNLKNCIFTGTGSGVGVTTLVNRVGELLESMGRPIVLVDATGAAVSRAVDGAQALVPAERVSRPSVLLQQMAAGTETEEGRLVLTDTAPLAVSAETEYLARFVDCAIVIIESGVTTRAQLREAAATLQRLNVGAVGFVLNRVGLAKADPAFRASVEAVEKHLKAQGSNAARRTERHSPLAPEQSAARDAHPKTATARVLFEPEAAAVAAAAARFSSPSVLKAAVAPAVCPSSSMVFAPAAEAAKRFSLPLASASTPETDEAVASPAVAESAVTDPVLAEAATPASPAAASTPSEEAEKADSSPEIADPVAAVVPQEPSAPFAEAAIHFSPSLTAEPDVPCSLPVETASAVLTPAPAVEQEPSIPAVDAISTTEKSEPAREPEAAHAPEPMQSETPPASDLPWWLSDAPRSVELVRPAVLWQPAKAWSARPGSADAATSPVAANENQELRQSWVNTGKLLERMPSQHEAPEVESPGVAAAQEAQKSDTGEAPSDRTSRLGGLRNLLFVLGVKDAPAGEAQAQQHGARASNFETRNVRSIPENREGIVGGASPRLVTAPPEFLPPKPVVIEFDHADARVGESSTRQDRRAAADGIEILPSKRGQYKKI
jgi:uncharacterized protein involved in exopolysaccharide biosynthesis